MVEWIEWIVHVTSLSCLYSTIYSDLFSKLVAKILRTGNIDESLHFVADLLCDVLFFVSGSLQA